MRDGLQRRYCGTANYMLPEIHQKVPYKGDRADLFALATMIFAMTAARFPWNEAKQSDFYFKHFANQNDNMFFAFHARKLGQDYFTDDLKDLLTKLWNQELSLDMALRHQYFGKSCDLTKQEVLSEF